MKKISPVLKAVLYSFAFIFISAADLITASGSFLLWGEPKCPKGLLK
ncbi:AgrD family cyclic lactone autoinducer peptide [Petroclostridium sp. X23]|nr:cyclic lactone autoinducer peptide [Petroclostridium sp. X23]WHH57667.1 cyclic lactone autoinducer peptide [Petroclostridium sp. X23]